MSVTYGFYNSINHDRKYDAVQFASIFDGIISDGVYENIKSSPNDPNSSPFKVKGNGYKNQVTVDVGRAWFYHTWTYNDAKIVVTLPDASIGKWRCDAIVIDIDSRQTVRENKIICVQGTKTTTTEPSSGLDAFVNVYKPDLINDGLHYQIPLYYIERRRIEDENQSPNIEDAYLKRCVGDGSLNCPYVGNMLGSIDLQAHLDHWESAWYEWFENQDTGFKKVRTDQFNAFVTTQETLYNNWVRDFNTYSSQQHALFESWREEEEAEFLDWVDHLRNVLDGDVAGHLLMEIDRLAERITPIEYGGTGNDNGYIQTGNIMGNYPERYSEPGDYATAEGMFTSAPGIASHAEGGGQFVATFHEAGFSCDRLLSLNDDSTYYSNSSFETDITGNNTEMQLSDSANYSAWMKDSEGNEFSINQNTKNKTIKSIYIAAILTNETTGEIVKKDIGCLGADLIGKRNYIGHASEIENIPASKFPPGGSSLTKTPVDIGWLKPQYSLGFGRYDNEYKASDNEMYVIQNGDSSSGTVTFNNLNQLSKRIVIATVDGDVLYKGNLRPQETNDPVVISVFAYKHNAFHEHGPLCKIQATITIGMTRYEMGYGYWCDGTAVCDYSYSDLTNVPDSVLHIDVRNYPENEDFPDGYFKDEDLVPYEYGGTSYWYMDGNKPENSNVLVVGTFGCRWATFNGSNYHNAPGVDFKSGIISEDYYFSQLQPLIMLNNVTDEYSLKFYYSYTTTDDTVDYPIEWQPAGYTKTGIGYPTRAIGRYSHAEGHRTKAYGLASHAEGYVYDTSGEESDLPGAYGEGSHCEGKDTYARGDYSHAEGEGNKALGLGSHAEGKETTADGSYSHVEGFSTHTVDYSGTNKGNYAHAEGESTRAYGQGSHAEGCINFAGGAYSHAEGINCNAYGMASHSEGYQALTTSGSDYAHAGGKGGVAHILGQFVHGHFGFGGTAQEFINTDGTVTFPNTIPGFNGGSFYFKNTESTAKTVHVDLMYNRSDGTGKIEGLMATWLIIKRDVPVTGVSNIASHACVWLATVKNNTGGIQLHEIYRSDDTELACSVSPDGNGVKFTVKGSGSNNGLAAAAQIIRIM